MSRRPAGAAWQTARTLRVRAELAGAVRVHRDWPAPLDGLLASPRVVPRQITAGTHGLLPSAALPLVSSLRVSNWWWWCSCAVPAPEPSWWTDRWTLRGGDNHTVVLPRGTALEWWAVGDLAGLRRLLERIPRLGLGDRRNGQSAASWSIVDEGEPDYELVLFTDDDTPGRPLPARYATDLGWPDDVDTIPGASRPPYAPTHTGTGDIRTRHLAPVIAPWAVSSPDLPAQLAGTPLSPEM